jgi:hypothetical protein
MWPYFEGVKEKLPLISHLCKSIYVYNKRLIYKLQISVTEQFNTSSDTFELYVGNTQLKSGI